MSKLTTGLVEANGTRLYHELRGSGPPLLFISGATGDAGHFESVAERLASRWTVVTYDRRGNSRSPRTSGVTSMGEQAADAAALVSALGLGRVPVFGTSGGAIIALAMLLEQAHAVRAAVLHEPPLAAVVPGAAEALGALRAGIDQAMAAGGPPAAVEAFVRDAAGASYAQIPDGTRARMLGNGETLFGAELEAFVGYRPDEAALARVTVPVRLFVGTDTTPLFSGAAAWLASRLRVPVARLAGGHTPYFDRPIETADALDATFREVV